jgi:hypothetical protein
LEFTDSLGKEQVTIQWNPVDETAHAFGREGVSVIATSAYWFAWYNFHPQTFVFKADTQRQSR